VIKEFPEWVSFACIVLGERITLRAVIAQYLQGVVRFIQFARGREDF
jgi:hypothetical protein